MKTEIEWFDPEKVLPKDKTEILILAKDGDFQVVDYDDRDFAHRDAWETHRYYDLNKIKLWAYLPTMENEG